MSYPILNAPGAAASRGPREFRVIEKLSRASCVLGDNEAQWEQEAFEFLLKQHPWVGRLTVRAELRATDPGGYGVGFFHLTSRHVPASVSGASTIGVVTVPIIIKDFILAPLDVFAFKDKLYPLSESRVTSLLRSRDIVLEADQEERRDSLGSRGGTSRSLRDRMAHSGGGGLLGKLSAVESAFSDLIADQLELQGLAEAAEAATKGENPWELDACERLEKVSAAEIRTGTVDTEARMIWASHPKTGLPHIGQWEPIPLHALETAFGAEKVSKALEENDGVLLLTPAGPRDTELAELSLQYRNAWERPASQKTSGTFSPGEFVEGLLAMGGEERRVRGYRVKGDCQTAFTVCGDSGASLILGEGSYGDAPVTVLRSLSDDEVPAHVTPTVAYRVGGASDTESGESAPLLGTSREVAGAVVLWYDKDEGPSYSTLDLSKAIHVEGEMLYPCADGGSRTRVALSPVKKEFSESRGELRIRHLPDPEHGGVLLEVKQLRNPDTLEGQLLTAIEQSPLLPEFGDESVEISKTSQGFVLESPYLPAALRAQDLRQSRAGAALATLGASPAYADFILEKASEWGSGTFPLDPETVPGKGRRVADALKASIQAKLSKVRPYLEEARHSARGFHAAAQQMRTPNTKLSAALVDETVDGALHLGFLNEENLLRFIDLLPKLETTLSSVCALLVASRLGLEEVDDVAAETAMRSLDNVIRGLKTIEYSLNV